MSWIKSCQGRSISVEVLPSQGHTISVAIGEKNDFTTVLELETKEAIAKVDALRRDFTKVRFEVDNRIKVFNADDKEHLSYVVLPNGTVEEKMRGVLFRLVNQSNAGRLVRVDDEEVELKDTEEVELRSESKHVRISVAGVSETFTVGRGDIIQLAERGTSRADAELVIEQLRAGAFFFADLAKKVRGHVEVSLSDGRVGVEPYLLSFNDLRPQRDFTVQTAAPFLRASVLDAPPNTATKPGPFESEEEVIAFVLKTKVQFLPCELAVADVKADIKAGAAKSDKKRKVEDEIIEAEEVAELKDATEALKSDIVEAKEDLTALPKLVVLRNTSSSAHLLSINAEEKLVPAGGQITAIVPGDAEINLTARLLSAKRKTYKIEKDSRITPYVFEYDGFNLKFTNPNRENPTLSEVHKGDTRLKVNVSSKLETDDSFYFPGIVAGKGKKAGCACGK